MSSTTLTKEQQEFLNSLEEEFKDRFTENDEEFKAVLNEELPLPPIVENYREFRQFDDRFGNDQNDSDYNRYRYGYNQCHFRYYRNNDSGRYFHSSNYAYRHSGPNHSYSRYRPY